MTFLAVLPSIAPDWTETCVDTMGPDLFAELLVIDNAAPRDNLGVAASWNVGVREMRHRNVEWLVVVSAAMRFGPPGGSDFLDALDQAEPGVWAIEGGEQPRRLGHGFGWHLIAFRSSTFDRVGLFDENFWPAYFEDNDFGHRIRVAERWEPGPDPIWPKVDVDADLAGYGHGVRHAGVLVDPDALRSYYIQKWGGPPAHEEYEHPFNDPDAPLAFWPTPSR